MTLSTVTIEFVQQFNKNPDVDKDCPQVELYCDEYRNHNCVPHSSNVRNYIFNDRKLFLEGYPYSVELSRDNLEGLEFEKCRFFEAHEGTLIRVFNINGKWYTSTNRRLDSFNSKWAAKTTTFGLHFASSVRENIRALTDGEIFEDDEKLEDRKVSERMYLNEIYERNLNKSKKYMFLLEPSKEERIVCTTRPYQFFNIGIFDENNNLSFDEEVTMDGFTVPRPKELMFESIHDMLFALDDVKINDIQGFIAIQKEPGRRAKHFKILNDRYKYLFNLRGNKPSLRFRFLELEYQQTTINLNHGTNHQVTQQVHQMFNDFIALYQFDFQPLLNYIWNTVVEDLYNKYNHRYIKKGLADPTITSKQTKMLEEIHRCFIKYHHLTTKLRIRDIFAMQKPSDQNQLIAEYEKRDKDIKRNNRSLTPT